MSGFISTQNFPSVYAQNDDSLQSIDYRTSIPYAQAKEFRHSDTLWPRSGFIGQPGSSAFSPVMDNVEDCWEWGWNSLPSGHKRRWIVSGVTRDSANNAISGVTVELFNSANGAYLDSAVSDSGGNYRVGDPYNANCFVSAWLSGAPNTAGITFTNIVGT